MRKAIIDVGSNSVRLCIFADGLVIFRDKITAQIAMGIDENNNLNQDSIARGVSAIKSLIERAIAQGVNKKDIYAFATAAIRNSNNGNDFCGKVKAELGLEIEVISGEKEGEIALLGVFSGGDGACVDIGGASTELVIAKDGKIIYANSIKIGAVVLYDLCKENRVKLQKTIDEKLAEFDGATVLELTAIGGTNSTMAMLERNMREYDRDLVHNTYIPFSDVEMLVERLFTLTKEQRINILGIKEKRAKIICGGALLLLSILRKFNLSGVTVSENDNLEGYFRYLEGMRYEK